MEKCRAAELTLALSIDDEIHSNFLADFPQYADAEALRHLDENEMKSAKGKVRWRKFIMPVS